MDPPRPTSGSRLPRPIRRSGYRSRIPLGWIVCVCAFIRCALCRPNRDAGGPARTSGTAISPAGRCLLAAVDALAGELQLLLTHPDGSGRLPAVQQPAPLGHSDPCAPAQVGDATPEQRVVDHSGVRLRQLLADGLRLDSVEAAHRGAPNRRRLLAHPCSCRGHADGCGCTRRAASVMTLRPITGPRPPWMRIWSSAGSRTRRRRCFRAWTGRARLSGRSLTRRVVLSTIKRRAAAAGVPASTCCHTFRATAITAYLSNGGRSSTRNRLPATRRPGRRTHRDLTGGERARPGVARPSITLSSPMPLSSTIATWAPVRSFAGWERSPPTARAVRPTTPLVAPISRRRFFEFACSLSVSRAPYLVDEESSRP